MDSRHIARDLRPHGRCHAQRLHGLSVRRRFQIQGAGLNIERFMRAGRRRGREGERPGCKDNRCGSDQQVDIFH